MTSSDNVRAFQQDRYDANKERTIYYHGGDARVERILSLLTPSDHPTKGLDVGCFDGTIASRARDRVGPLCEMHGIDVAEGLRSIVEPKGIRFSTADLNTRINFADNTFDFIIAGEIIEHLYDTDLFVDELRRILRPGGILILTTPNVVSLGRRIHAVLGNGAFMEASLTYPLDPKPAGHIRFFSRDLLVGFLQHRGFRVDTYCSDTVNLP